MVVLRGEAVSHERGAPVAESRRSLAQEEAAGRQGVKQSVPRQSDLRQSDLRQSGVTDQGVRRSRAQVT
jgi:hypothetical protein